jgi:uncharacterized membrane protein
LDDGRPAELSNDASVIVGCTNCGRVGNVAAAWSRGTAQPFSIGFPDSGVSPYRSYANGVSRDGSVILGDGLVTAPEGSTAPDSYDAYIWRKDHGGLIDLVAPSCDDVLALQPDSTRNGEALSGDARLITVCTQTNEESGCWLLGWP